MNRLPNFSELSFLTFDCTFIILDILCMRFPLNEIHKLFYAVLTLFMWLVLILCTFCDLGFRLAVEIPVRLLKLLLYYELEILTSVSWLYVCIVHILKLPLDTYTKEEQVPNI